VNNVPTVLLETTVKRQEVFVLLYLLVQSVVLAMDLILRNITRTKEEIVQTVVHVQALL
jgi:hypothetical protein